MPPNYCTRNEFKMVAKSGPEESTSNSMLKEKSMPKSEKLSTAKDADAAWGWIVVLGSHICHQLVWGMFRSTGILLVEWKDTFDAGAAAISAVASSLSASLLVTGPIAGFLCKRYGCRVVTILGGFLSAVGILAGSQAQNIPHLCISVGGITGMGFSLAYMGSAVIPGHYFDKRFALANGISSAGSGVGVMIIPPLVQILIEFYGWRGSMMVMSMVIANVCAFGALYRPVNPNKNVHSESVESYNQTKGDLVKPIATTQSKTPHGNREYVHLNNSQDVSVKIKEEKHEHQRTVCQKILFGSFKIAGLHLFWKSRRFFVLCLTQIIIGIGYSGVMVHIINHIRLVCHERTSVEVSLILSVIGTGSMVARAGHGILVDKKYLTPMAGYTIGIIGSSIAILLAPAISNYLWFAVFGVVCGLGIGLNLSLLRVLVKEFLGIRDMAQGIGLSGVVFFGTGDLIGPLISGWLYDISGSYSVAFFVMGGLLFIACPMMLLMPLFQRSDLKYKALKTGVDTQENGDV